MPHLGLDFEPTIRSCSIILYTTNGIFLLLGSICVAIGMWLQLKSDLLIMELTHWANQLYGEDPYDIPVLMSQSSFLFTLIGSVSYVLSLVGQVGTVRRWKWFLYVYSGVLIFVLFIQLGLMSLVLYHRAKFKERAQQFMVGSAFTWYRGPDAFGPSRGFSTWVDYTQIKMQCCGVMGSQDFKLFNEWNHTWYHPTNGSFHVAQIPFTCCKTLLALDRVRKSNFIQVAQAVTDPMCPVHPTKDNSYKDRGCYDALVAQFTFYVNALVAVFIILSLLEIVSCAAGLAMAVRIHTFDDLHLNW